MIPVSRRCYQRLREPCLQMRPPIRSTCSCSMPTSPWWPLTLTLSKRRWRGVVKHTLKPKRHVPAGSSQSQPAPRPRLPRSRWRWWWRWCPFVCKGTSPSGHSMRLHWVRVTHSSWNRLAISAHVNKVVHTMVQARLDIFKGDGRTCPACRVNFAASNPCKARFSPPEPQTLSLKRTQASRCKMKALSLQA